MWKDSLVPELWPFLTTKDSLEHHYIFLNVKGNANADDEIGQGSISLAGSFDKPAEFVVELLRFGMLQGVVRGSI